jgi:hypothetical protein
MKANLIQKLKQYYNIDIIVEQDDYSVKFYEYYFDKIWKVAIQNNDIVEIYDSEGLLINELGVKYGERC